MDLERLVDLVEPFGTVGGATAAALIERQFQLAQQARDLLPRRYVAHARTGAERGLVEVVERGQPARKELAVNHALGETIDRAEAEPERQIVEAIGDQLLVVRYQHRQSVADHDTVAAVVVQVTALGARI